ncbi:MAG: ankyrin repeat domain-containing protein [Acidobacteriota bacterium]|nr:ankyrin repeat domain-containing protein [Acidobacteriota bacterium]
MRKLIFFLAMVVLIAAGAFAADVNKNDAFLKAVEERDVRAVKRFLAGGIDVKAHNSSGETALHLAAANDTDDIIALLVKAGADVNAKDDRGRTPLFAAVTNGYGGVKATPPLIAAGADLKTTYQSGNSIVFEAANSDAAVPLQALIKAGAEIDAPNEQGDTPLFLAASLGRKVTPLLIKLGANVNAKNKEGDTPLISAAEGGELESMRLLIEAKANVNAADDQTRTALLNVTNITAAQMNSFKIDEAGVTKMVEMLLAAGADVKAKRKFDATTPLMAAAREGHADAVSLLIAAKSPLNSKSDPDGYTPLIEAAKAGHTEVVKRLLAAGADPKIKDRVGRTARAWGADYPEVVALLGGSATPSKTAAQAAPVVSADQKEKARQKLEELGITDLDQSSFLRQVTTGQVEAVQAFIDYGINVNAKDPDDHVTTPLLAAAHDQAAVGILLIKAGANVNAKDTNGATPLLWASEKCNQTPLVKALIKAGADVNAKAAGGGTPYMMAEVMKCMEMLKLLKAAGAKK